MKISHLFSVVVILFLLAACTVQKTDATSTVAGENVTTTLPPATGTPPPSATAARTPSVTPSPTGTPIASWCPPASASSADETSRWMVAYVQDGNLWVMSNGETPRLLVDFGDVSDVIISGDGARVAFIRRVVGLNQELWVVPSDGGSPKQLITVEWLEQVVTPLEPTPDQETGVGFESVQWLPGTHRLVFTGQVEIEALGSVVPDHLWSVDADTGRIAVVLDKGEGGWVSISPDGSLMTVADETGIDLVSVGGADRQDVTPPGYLPGNTGEGFTSPNVRWAPDSESFVLLVPEDSFSFTCDTSTQVWRISRSGDSPQLLGDIKSPFVSISPDTAFASYWCTSKPMTNDRILHMVSLQPYEDAVFAWGESAVIQDWSPDSSRVLFAELGSGNPAYQPEVTVMDLCGSSTKIYTASLDFNARWVSNTQIVVVENITYDPTYNAGDIFLIDESGEASPIGQNWSAFDFIALPEN